MAEPTDSSLADLMAMVSEERPHRHELTSLQETCLVMMIATKAVAPLCEMLTSVSLSDSQRLAILEATILILANLKLIKGEQ